MSGHTLSEPVAMRIQKRKLDTLEEELEPWQPKHDKAMLAYEVENLVEQCTLFPDEYRYLWQTLKKAAELYESLREPLAISLQLQFKRAIQISKKVSQLATDFSRETGHAIAGQLQLREAVQTLTTLENDIFLGMDMAATYKACKEVNQGKVYTRDGRLKQHV